MSNFYDPEFIIEGLADVSPMLLAIQANAGVLMSKIYVVNSDMKNVIGKSDPNVMFKGPGPLLIDDLFQ